MKIELDLKFQVRALTVGVVSKAANTAAPAEGRLEDRSNGMSRLSLPSRALYLVLLLSLAVSSARGQRSASLAGTVFDPDGAVIRDVAVRLVNTSTGEELAASSNLSGTYVFPLLPNGVYDLTAKVKGFKTYNRPGLEISTGQAARADLQLEVGVVTEVVTVRADVPQLRTEDAAVSSTIRNETIANMPLIDRRAAQLARLNGFVVQNGTASNFTMAGGRGFNAMWTLDGGIVQNVTLGTSELMFDPPIEAMEEFTVSISNYKAEMGRSGGGVVRMTTRAGGNDVHGSLYEFLRNDALDARNFFSGAKPTLRRNQFGGSLGGPIKRNKTHFFFNVEAQRQDREQTQIRNVPDPTETQGRFSRAILDPATFIDGDRSTGTAFPNNTIPTSRFDPVGAQLAALYPAPNVPGARARRLNYRVNQPISNDAVYWFPALTTFSATTIASSAASSHAATSKPTRRFSPHPASTRFTALSTATISTRP